MSRSSNIKLWLWCACLCVPNHLFGQMAILDSLNSPTYVAWEYQMEEVQVIGDDPDDQNAQIGYYKSNPLSSIGEVVQRLDGFSMIRRGNYAMEPVMRGLSAGQINTTIDEMRILGACTDKMDPVTSYVEPNNLDKLQVMHGAGGFTCGSTVGGCLDMKIKKPPLNAEKEWGGSLGARYLSAANGVEGLFNTAYSTNKFGVRLGATYRTANDYRAGGGDIVAHSGYNKFNYSLSASYLTGGNGIINFSFIGDDGWDIGFPALPMDVGSARARILGLTYEKWYPQGRFSTLTLKVYYNQVTHEMDDSQRDVSMHMDMPGWTRTYGAFGKTEYRINGKLNGRMKVDLYRTSAHADMTMYQDGFPPMYMLTWPDVDRLVTGFNHSNTYVFGAGSKLTGGFRLEHNRVGINSKLGEQQLSVFQFGAPNDGQFLMNANLGFEQKISKQFGIDGALRYGQRMPTEGEQYGFYLFNAYDGYDYIGKPNLQSENTIQLESSLNIVGEKIRMRLTGYYYHFNNYIMGRIDPELSPMTPGANGVKIYENIPQATLAGVESNIDIKLNRFNILNISKYTYGKDHEGSPLPMMPPFKNNLALTYTTIKSLMVRIEVEASTSQERINADFGERPTPGYVVASLAIARNFTIGQTGVKALLGFDNVFDARYYEHLDWGQIPRPGRNVHVGLYLNL